MNRVILVALAALGLVGSATVHQAAAESPQQSHKVCVELHGANRPLPPSLCVGWDDPAQQ